MISIEYIILYNTLKYIFQMAYATVLSNKVFLIQSPLISVLIGITVLGLFIVGFDQGQIFSIVEGNEAFDSMMMHEFTHDLRHAAGYPCH